MVIVHTAHLFSSLAMAAIYGYLELHTEDTKAFKGLNLKM